MSILQIQNDIAEREQDIALARLKNLLTEGDVRQARLLVGELVRTWPESPRIQYYSTLLSPPKVKITTSEMNRRTRSQERDWLKKNAHRFPGEWIALFGDQLIAHDSDLKKVQAEAQEKLTESQAFLHYQPKMEG